ncbi:MAG TPA: ABC transporter ATP-binding protein [Planctomycetaceae bacterium]|nr:ABC transporter ATP-binding protein [Planctomycetaceae bacterium]HIQ19861.1 ABC transporter ATP-binding protein [Planctomycetota bacterium]
MSSANGYVLRTEHVEKFYPDGNVYAVVDVSLAIQWGEYIAIMGPSGSGKSTLLNLLGGLDVPTSGTVYFDGQPLSQLPSLDRFRSEKVGFVFQSFYLLPTLTARENVQIPMFEGPLSAPARAKKADELLAAVGLAHRAGHLPSRLSVGERQRVAIARALANDPVVLLADEPTGNLDSRSGQEVLDLFDRLHNERGMSIVMITHSDEVASRAQRILRIHDGRLVGQRTGDGPMAERH